MKRVFLNYLAGIDASTLDQYAREFVNDLIPNGLYAEVVDEVDFHKSEGRMTILNSASPEIWVQYIAEHLGFDHFFGTRVEFTKRVPLFPKITGGNNKGAAKIGRMKHLFPEGWKDGDVLPASYGYSDSHADLPMLHICERNVMVHPTDKLREVGVRFGWKEIAPARPTKTKSEFAIACAKQAVGGY